MKMLALLFIRSFFFFRLDLAYSDHKTTVWPTLAKEDGSKNFKGIAEWCVTETRSLPQLSGKKDVLGRIFRKAPGHFSIDSPENRALLILRVEA